MTTTPHGQVPEALPAIQRFEVVDCIDSKHVPAVIPNPHGPWVRYEDHAAALCRLHAENEALRAQQDDAYDHGPQAETVEEAARDVGKWLNERPNRPLDLRHVAMLTQHAKRTAHVQNPAEIEHVAGDVVKNGAEVNMSTQQPAPAGAAPECLTCNDHGAVGNILTAEPCPDCTRWNSQPAPATPITVEQVEDAIGLQSSAWDTIGAEKIVEAVLRLANAAPATQQAGDVVAYLDVGASGYLDLGAALSEDALQQLPKGRHALVIAGTYGIDGYVAAPQPSPTTKPAPQQEAQEPTEIPEEIERMAADRYKVVPSHESMFHRWAVVAGTGTQQLYLGREVECQNMARKFAGAFLDGAFVAMQRTAPQPAPAPLSDTEKAVRQERERLCAAIKAEDDYCIDNGDYMLDSDDCIKIVKGEWVRPDFSAKAAMAEQGGK